MRRSRVFKPFVMVSLLLLIISLACNIGGSTPVPATKGPDNPPTQTEAPPPTDAPSVPTPTEAQAQSSGAVSSIAELQSAIVKIEVQGSFRYPEGTYTNAGGWGTGFIIDPSGIAVTNNHVVTGAALVRVYVGNETQPRNARILGVSECSDLAVIDIDGGGYPYLEWYDGRVTVGESVFAAGYPVPEGVYTMTDGIVSSVNASGETVWASVDYVYQHTARINPGNSGGPLVNSSAKVVGVNFSGISTLDANYAISYEEAMEVIDDLKAGRDVDSIGVNGMTLYEYYAGGDPIYGVWVTSVKAGSPADRARIVPGDIIWHLGGEVLGVDGSMSDYCDVIRSHRSSDTIDVAVIRLDNDSYMEGQLNGRELEFIGYLGGGSSNTNNNSSTTISDYGLVNDDGTITWYDNSFTIETTVPGWWTQYDGSSWVLDNQNIGWTITAAPDLNAFNSRYDAEGVFFGASDTFARWGGYIQFLDIYTAGFASNCDPREGRYDYNDGVYRGKYDYYRDCGPGRYDSYVLSAVSIADQGAYIILVMIQVPPYETDTVELIWNTFYVWD